MQTKEDLMHLGFPEKEALVLLEFLENEMFSKEDFTDNNLCFDLSQYEFCKIKLTLKNVLLNTEIPIDDEVILEKPQISKTENGYSLTGEAHYYDFEQDKDITFPLCIEFESAETSCKSIKSKFCVFDSGNPWESLAYYAACIYEKVKRPYLTANEKEKALEPLLKEFYILNCWYKEFDNIRLDVLKKHLPESAKLNHLFESIEKSKSDEKRSNAVNKLFAYMSCKKFEESWRSLLDLLNNSQSEYEEEKEPELSSALIDEHRRIEEIMHDNGYEGAYPVFEKHTKIKGVHLIKNNGEIFLAGMEETAIFIECADNIFDHNGTVEFRISTVLGKSDKVRDKYSCLFAKKGKGYYRTEYIMYETDESGALHFFDGSDRIPHIVCKLAELKKLSKEEKRIYPLPKTKEEIYSMVLLSLIIGIFVGIFATLGFMLIEFLITLFFGLIADFPQLFLETPWWMIFLFAWLVFSIIMSVFSIVSD